MRNANNFLNKYTIGGAVALVILIVVISMAKSLFSTIGDAVGTPMQRGEAEAFVMKEAANMTLYQAEADAAAQHADEIAAAEADAALAAANAAEQVAPFKVYALQGAIVLLAIGGVIGVGYGGYYGLQTGRAVAAAKTKEAEAKAQRVQNETALTQHVATRQEGDMSVTVVGSMVVVQNRQTPGTYQFFNTATNEFVLAEGDPQLAITQATMSALVQVGTSDGKGAREAAAMLGAIAGRGIRQPIDARMPVGQEIVSDDERI